ncbi:CHASE sensor domain-containing protein [Sulfurospirillum oryzae]|uniref:CHASE sensor domain-containing protein n=1 Tax=Sulfurospirillum oryzae TaxID=2976535 RepID=UPI0021E77436|nr:CHASE sensor domain-containing protein [Sulfurospirillum oryzae]
MRFKHLSIRHKLLVFLASSAALALVISSLLIIVYTQKMQHAHLLDDLEQSTNVMSTNMQASVLFHDEISAHKMLLAFESNPHIMSAWVLDEEGRMLSAFTSKRHSAKEVETLNATLEFLIQTQKQKLFEKQESVQYTSDSSMAIVDPIVYEGNTIGALVIASDTMQFKQMMYDFIMIQVFISLVTLAIIFLLSWWGGFKSLSSILSSL